MPPPTVLTLAARGANYLVYRAPDVVLLRVVQRKDLTSVEGARCAEDMGKSALRLIAEGAARAFIFDIRFGPPVFGPRTETALRSLFGALANGRVTIRCLVSDNPLQELQYGRLLRDVAPRRSEICKSFAVARDALLPGSALEEPALDP